MPIFVIFIVVSITLYLFYKVREFRSKLPYYKGWAGSKAKIALGVFLLSFGLNELSSVNSRLQLWVAIVFSIYGCALLYTGYKRYRHFLPLAQDEAENRM